MPAYATGSDEQEGPPQAHLSTTDGKVAIPWASQLQRTQGQQLGAPLSSETSGRKRNRSWCGSIGMRTAAT